MTYLNFLWRTNFTMKDKICFRCTFTIDFHTWAMKPRGTPFTVHPINPLVIGS